MAISRTNTQPIPVRRSTRRHDLRVLTSLPAGKMVPIAAVPLLREDGASGSMRLNFEMQETVEVLMNAVNVNVKAYLVPNLAFERFLSMDDINRSYEGVPRKAGEQVIPWFEFQAAGAHGSNKIHLHMGKHVKPGTSMNMAYVEAYNEIWNFRATNRSPKIAKRARLDTSLAPAFWQHEQFAHIVPDFDQAVIDGQVALNFTTTKLPIRGISIGNTAQGGLRSGIEGDGSSKNYTNGLTVGNANGSGNTLMHINQRLVTGSVYAPDIFTELADAGVTVSLANLELARKTQAFAKMRAQFTGLSDEFLIDLLMDGIEVPEQAWHQPMLLADKSVVFGMSKRYASDSADLTASVVNGATFVDLSINVPKCPTGGIIMIVAEIAPEQLFERMRDPYLHATSVAQLPQFLRDELDPEKVSIVQNGYVDVQHATATDTFGYAPLNFEWNQNAPGIGGKFFRPAADASFDEDRQRIWAVETLNPKLSEDFYLCTTMHTKPFVVTNQDPFEAVARGELRITGNTVFGGLLVEASKDYAEVLAEAPKERIQKPAS